MNYQYLHFNNIWGLYRLIIDLKKHPYQDFLKQQFNNFHQHYMNTLNLLKILGFIYEENRAIKIFPKYKDSNSEHWISSEGVFNNTLINKCFEHEECSCDIEQLLNKCHYINNRYIIQLDSSENLYFSDIRNFYISLGFIICDGDSRNYFINPEHNELINKTTDRKIKKLSIINLEKIQENKKQIGWLAERAVMDYEINKLKNHPHFTPNLIQQISEVDVNAGFDILSYKPINDSLLPIKIEVKAVSPKTYQFYFSKNEMNIASQLGNQYYLYLLPALNNSSFDINHLKIIRNPIEHLFNQNNGWISEIENLSFKH